MRIALILIACIGAIALVCFIYFLSRGNHNENYIKLKKIFGIISAVLVTIEAVLGIVTMINGLLNPTADTVIINQNKSDYELLKEAEIRFDAGDYESVVEIYSLQRFENNALACSNLGYMYAKGIYFDKSIEMAKRYFDKAIDNGDQNAALEVLAMYIENDIQLAAEYYMDMCEESSVFSELSMNMDLNDAATLDDVRNALWEHYLTEEYETTSSKEMLVSDLYVRYTEVGRDTSINDDGVTTTTIFYYDVTKWVLSDPQRLYYVFRR